MLVEGLQLQFDRVSTALNRLADHDPTLWMLGKLHAYRGQTEPFVHLDTDVFLWKRLPDHIESSPVFTQTPEHFVIGESYYKPDEIRRALTHHTRGWIPLEWEWSLSHGNLQPAACCGVLGGSNVEFIHYYADLAIRLLDDSLNRDGWSLLRKCEHTISLEQFHLAACVNYHRNRPDSPYCDVEMRYVFDSWADAANPNIAAKIGFTHMHVAAKQDRMLAARLENRVRNDYSHHYDRCARYVRKFEDR